MNKKSCFTAGQVPTNTPVQRCIVLKTLTTSLISPEKI